MRDFSKVRLSGTRTLYTEEGLPLITASRLEEPPSAANGYSTGRYTLDPEETSTFVAQLAARWNACADALAYLEGLQHRTNEELTVLGMLRPAVHGEA